MTITEKKTDRGAGAMDMLTCNLWKGVLLFSLPLVASNLLQVLFNMADIAVIGQFGGAMSLGSVGSTSILVSLFTGFLLGLGSGVNVTVARRLGEGNVPAVRESVHTSLVIAVIYGLVMTLAGVLACAPILTLMNTKEELFDGAVLYFRIYMLGCPAMAVYNFGSAVWSAAGNTRKPLIYLSIAGGLNVALNLFFVLLMKLDVAGVALASVISQYVSAVLVLISLFRCKGEWGLRVGQLKLRREPARQILRLSVPSGLQYATFAIANLFVQSGVNSFSAIMVSGNTAAANADSIIYDVMAAFYTGCASFMGQNYGAGNRRRVRDSYLVALVYSFAVGAILGLGIMFNGRAFLSLFSGDAGVIEAGMLRLSVMGWSYAFSAFMDNTLAACRALGRTLVPTIVLMLGSCVFRIVWIYTVFAAFHTIQALYLVYISSWTVTATLEIICFVRSYRQLVVPLKPRQS